MENCPGRFEKKGEVCNRGQPNLGLQVSASAASHFVLLTPCSYLSSPAAQSIWPLFQKYLSRYFQWSPQILDIAEQAHTFLKLRSHFSSFTGERYMALHLHRGMLIT